MYKISSVIAIMFVGFLAFATPVLADEIELDITETGYIPQNLLMIGGGYFDALKKEDEAVSFNLEWHPDVRYFDYIAPFVGVMATSDMALYGFGGLGLDIGTPVPNLRLFPSVAVGAYDDGEGKDLKHWFEIRTGVEAHYYLPNEGRIGVGFHHISNANLGFLNPGVEIISFSYAHPLDSLFGH